MKKHNVKAHFFFTGNFYRNAAFENSIKKLKKEGHYLGAHSDRHLLYVSWEKRDSTLISEEEFKDDITGNYDEMSRFEIAKEDAMYFMPPFEWYNQEIADWTKALGLVLINHTPGTRSAADYTTPAMVPGYVDSPTIIKSILEYESMEKKGLNGFHLLVHFGSDPQRMDKLYYRLDQLIVELKYRGYEFGLLTDQ